MLIRNIDQWSFAKSILSSGWSRSVSSIEPFHLWSRFRWKTKFVSSPAAAFSVFGNEWKKVARANDTPKREKLTYKKVSKVLRPFSPATWLETTPFPYSIHARTNTERNLPLYEYPSFKGSYLENELKSLSNLQS